MQPYAQIEDMLRLWQKKSLKDILSFLLFFCLLLVAKSGLAQTTIIDKNSTWKYLDNGSNQGTSWISSSFNDASWSSGGAVLGYGTINGASISTTVSYGSNSNKKHITTYFRKQVTLSSPSFHQLQINLLVDDGAALYINGKLALADNLPSSWGHNTVASSNVSGSNEGDYETFVIPDTFLVNGVNTFAVEIHQDDDASSDIGFDIEVIGHGGKVVSGQVFLDMDGNGVKSSFDSRGSGAVEVFLYSDLDSNGIYTNSELVTSTLTDAYGYYSFFAADSVRHLAVALDLNDFDARVDYTTETTRTFRTDTISSDTIIADFGQLGPNSLCLIIADNQGNSDQYFLANRITGKQKFISTMSTSLIEALAIRIGMDSLWAFDDGQFGSVNISTGQFTTIGNGVGYGTGLIGGSSAGYTFTDIDGLAYDPNNDVLYGVERRSGSNDLLVAIDRKTGDLLNGFFGNGREFLEIYGTGIKEDVDDIAFNPSTGQLLAVNNENGGDSTRYISINPATGEGTVISLVGIGDFEGLGYYNTGELYGTTGDGSSAGYKGNSLYRIDKSTGAGTLLDSFSQGGEDLEACDCLTGPTENLISGVVFYDNDSSGTYDRNIDTAYGGVKVYLYRDANENGIIDSTDFIIDSVVTSPNTGFYVFITDSLGYFLTSPYINNTPFFTMNTTTEDSLTETAMFEMHGDFDGRNDFGFHITAGVPYLAVNFLEITAHWDNEHDAVVEWVTSSEINTSHFEVERSTDGSSFNQIGMVMSEGYSQNQNTYSFTDVEANHLNESIYFYRIKEVEYDQNVSYSPVVALEQSLDNFSFVFPNPFENELAIEVENPGFFELTITDVLGNRVHYQSGEQLQPNSTIEIKDLEYLPSGPYVIQLHRNRTTKVFTVVK